MKNILILAILFLLGADHLQSQNVDNLMGTTETIKDLPKEKVFVHYNTTFLFAGEYLYYRVYALNTDTGLLSGMSKIAYVELVGENGESFLKNKILLKNGLGQADFFLPATIPSGNYKLIGYTQWMNNDDSGNFFMGDVAVINPYQGDQRAVTDFSSKREEGQVDEGLENSEKRRALSSRPKDKNFRLVTSGKAFGRRDKVSLKIEGKNNETAGGNYSLSVRKIEQETSLTGITSVEYLGSIEDSRFNSAGKNNKIYLPELRGDLLSGTIQNLPGSNLPVEDQILTLSIPGEDAVLKVATTNDKGQFFFSIDEEYTGTQALIQIVEENGEKFSLNLNQSPQVNFSALNFEKFAITPAMEEMILDRSIYNQIENAYYGVKPDTIKAPEKRSPFYGERGTVYDLDAYTRFKTVPETFTEIIQNVWISNPRSERARIRMRQYEGSTDYGRPSMLVVDGVPVQDHRRLIDYSSRAIKSISVIRENYYIGGLVFHGVIAVETIEGNFHLTNPPDFIREIELEKPEPEKNYFRQMYTESTKNNRIPDYRYQLAWIPRLKMSGSETEVEFFTSDVPGEYEISIEGFTDKGEPVSLRNIILVK